MEREVGAQVAPPIFIHQALPGHFLESSPMAKKRDFPWQNPNFQLHHQQQQQQQWLNTGFRNPKNNWNPKAWDWDSVMFAAKPSLEAPEVLCIGTAAEMEHKKKTEESFIKPLVLKKCFSDEEDRENLQLKLGGGSYSVDEPAAARPNKRVRSGSPSGSSSYPMCQVDDCKGDLSNAKDYHRRHKVCELHSKTTKALVGKQMQRFCQQCSRFHPLSEFDEGKRSCRRRLAGHNRRRRKTQPEDVPSRLLLPGNRENSGSGSLDIVNLLTILARLQGNNTNKITNVTSLPDRDRLIQIISKINSLPVSANSSARLPVAGTLDLNISQMPQTCSEQTSKMNEISSSPSTVDLLAVLSAALTTSSPDTVGGLSQGSSDSSGDDKSKVNCLEKATGFNLQSQPSPVFPTVRTERNNGTFRSPLEVSEGPVQEIRQSLPLQLFNSSPEDNSPPKVGSARNYFSSESSNPMEERSSSSSPVVVQKLFPLYSATEVMKHERMAIEASTSHGWNSPLELLKGSRGRAENDVGPHLPYQAGYTSSSGSDHSPSSSNSDIQDRTGRIIFKLFDKDPSNIPGTIRTQILNWLSHSPSEMESYIRPGCVVLSVYVSMRSFVWEELEEDLRQRVSSLIQSSNSDFWRNGRFLIHTDRQIASHKDGKIRLCKSWRTWNAPELMSVSPLAVVGGQETSLVLRGHNLTVPGTKIHCTYIGGYISKQVSESAYSGTMYDDSSSESFSFPGGVPNVLGRCFIEVENGFKGNSFPVIIANATICQELRTLESEFKEDARVADGISEDHVQAFERPRSKEDILHFLNELGWLFQRKNYPTCNKVPNFSHARFKFLFIFSVERDWPALVRMLLDILVERDSDGLSGESLETLFEIHLLNRAVKRKCRKMVDMLLHYSLGSNSDSQKYLFTPNMAGSGGFTPLHLAACMLDSEDMVDMLSDDPQEIGLNCWNSLLDAKGQSPYEYAAMRNNHSYNSLVARKLAGKRNNQVSITISNEEVSLDQSWIIPEPNKPNPQLLQGRSCAQCAVMATLRLRRVIGAQGLLHRPYVNSLLAIAAVCVCVCVLFRGFPQTGSVAHFKWEDVDFGWS
eukprot:TRINITY_DN682_c0_g2_i1.p1 TRINITY_DN682_c0_g2~~TRINITY_DN682_c0_g2_i1.p1  ORF type:complete len:1086 (-),score=197.20 TRINITY_DN682_c0_g2_i1:605-3862(-)